MADLRRTPLFENHRAAGARFVEFGGWQMPVQYRGLLAEHEVVRTRAGVFDVSHMGEIEVRGEGALRLCQRLTTNDASRLEVGGAQYTVWCAADGGAIDDTILYRRGPEDFLFCVNASNAAICLEWITQQGALEKDVVVTDRSEETALLALQGPAAAGIARVLGGEWLPELSRFGCARGELAGLEIFGARTGYTGEDGFELFCRPTDASRLWEALLGQGVEPIGLGARDTLRLEAGLALYGHELSRGISPLEAGLGWAVKLDGDDFVGRDALLAQREAGPPRRLIGLGLKDKGIARAGYPVVAGEGVVGEVTSGTRSPTLGRAVALALVAAQWVDAELSIEIRGRRIPAEREKFPFYRRPATERNER